MRNDSTCSNIAAKNKGGLYTKATGEGNSPQAPKSQLDKTSNLSNPGKSRIAQTELG